MLAQSTVVVSLINNELSKTEDNWMAKITIGLASSALNSIENSFDNPFEGYIVFRRKGTTHSVTRNEKGNPSVLL